MHYTQVRGPKHRKQKELHSLEIHAHPDGTPDAPRWIVLHDFGPEHEPRPHTFDDHEALLEHIRRHTGTEPLEEQDGAALEPSTSGYEE